ncbi:MULTISPECIES: hypothetical protein [unclassified Paenibacillus]|uniref:hypothetical protein n=1 Tax=unclassified Paenibacillus TaxID=185978 RepID=UPI0009A8CDAB|nr:MULTISPECIES: hypothetical protein [unclassified Paenibacillus]SLK21704.1 hypothetical protein SAMN06272722_11958 [Paenibacillus sp. RU5A]SOC76708.1 hypothetical protein SAMN05880581_11958 [Paenibacillus sp. RU26A]SOC78099.1 hypothetical protein SAMN05880586_11958 [Paenibacillus sp. RU5M]
MEKEGEQTYEDREKINSIIDVVVSDKSGQEYKQFVELINSDKSLDDLAFELENLFLEQTRKSVIYAYKMGASEAARSK